MARKLSDLVNISHNTATIKIQDVELPISFSMEAMEYVGDCYGFDYAVFEEDLNRLLEQKSIVLNASNLKIMRSLIYGMVRCGETECTPQELNNAIPLSQVVDVFEVCLDLFLRQNFEESDLKKSVQPQDYMKKKNKKTKNRRK